MPLLDSDIQDLLTGTQRHFGAPKFNQIAQRLPRYEVFGKIMKEDKQQYESTVAVQRQLMVRQSGSARVVGLHEPDVVNIEDVMKTITESWSHLTANYAYERRELLENASSPRRIYDLIKVRRTDHLLSIVELMEALFWSKPTNSADTLKPKGVPYWVVANATEGFNGGDPDGFTGGAGGLPVAQAAGWKNYTFSYSAFTKADLVKKMRRAARRLAFKSPIDIDDYRKGNGQQYRIYVNESVQENLEDIGESQNENLGKDLAPMDGMMTFKRHPIIHVYQLDATADLIGVPQDPLYFLNMSYFEPCFLKGDYLRETDPAKHPDQHNTWVIHTDLTWQILCTNRRVQGVGYRA